jgi:hypothetical protein
MPRLRPGRAVLPDQAKQEPQRPFHLRDRPQTTAERRPRTASTSPVGVRRSGTPEFTTDRSRSRMARLLGRSGSSKHPPARQVYRHRCRCQHWCCDRNPGVDHRDRLKRCWWRSSPAGSMNRSPLSAEMLWEAHPGASHRFPSGRAGPLEHRRHPAAPPSISHAGPAPLLPEGNEQLMGPRPSSRRLSAVTVRVDRGGHLSRLPLSPPAPRTRGSDIVLLHVTDVPGAARGACGGLLGRARPGRDPDTTLEYLATARSATNSWPLPLTGWDARTPANTGWAASSGKLWRSPSAPTFLCPGPRRRPDPSRAS